ncbi:hypothetical protein BpHYR1_002316 [Brachionus plicatilis]|uniref:Uncharacterized protein n=1 Tax=Brachionus plicatilis TaxID=10195 RepID=A0A3M7RUD9_BRAPC|nr:hypothetical protein BpHYR1_002316 [Brachionus plicatilis]
MIYFIKSKTKNYYQSKYKIVQIIYQFYFILRFYFSKLEFEPQQKFRGLTKIFAFDMSDKNDLSKLKNDQQNMRHICRSVGKYTRLAEFNRKLSVIQTIIIIIIGYQPDFKKLRITQKFLIKLNNKK